MPDSVQQNETWFSKKSNQLHVIALLLLLIALVIALLVPPISLGRRVQEIGYVSIGTSGGAVAVKDGTRVEFPSQGIAAPFKVKLNVISQDRFLNGSAGKPYRVAAEALAKDNLVSESPLYALNVHGEIPQLSYLIIPVGTDVRSPETIDLYMWDVSANTWHWLPSHFVAEDHQVEAVLRTTPANFMLMQASAAGRKAVYVDLPADASLPATAKNSITDVNAFGLSLAGNGAITGGALPASGSGAGYRVWPVIRNWDDNGLVRTDLVYNVITQKDWQDANIEAISKLLTENGYPGVVIAYKGVDPDLRPDYVAFIRRLAERLHKEGKLLAVRVESPRQVAADRWDTGGYNWRDLGAAADLLEIPAPMDPEAYHTDGMITALLRWSVGEVNRRKLLIVLPAMNVEKAGNYFLPLDYSDALALLSGHIQLKGGGVAPGKTIEVSLAGRRLSSPLDFDADLQQYSYTYVDDSGQQRGVWLEDGDSLTHKLNLLRRFGINNVGVRSLMTFNVNPATWNVLYGFIKDNLSQPATGKYLLSWSVQSNGKTLSSGTSGLARAAYQWKAPENGSLVIKAAIVDSNGDSVPVATLAVEVATPVPLATATPTPTPTPEFAYVSFNNDVNIREGPSINYRKIGQAKAGDTYKVIGKNKEGSWWQIQFNDKPGWVLGKLVKATGPVSSVQVAKNIPPEPTPMPRAVAAGYFDYGVQAHMVDNGQAPKVMEMTLRMGFHWVKQQVEWKRYESSHGHRDFGPLEPVVQAANNAGTKLLLSVVSAPNWARPGGDLSVGGPPNNPQDLADFLGALAGHYCGSSVKAIEVWNEQNLHYEWGNQQIDPAAYMVLLKPAYKAIKAACPSMVVVSGALTPTGAPPPAAMDDFTYLAGMYRNGLRYYSDAIGAHPSGYNVAPWVRGGAAACQFITEQHSSFTGPCDSPHHSWSFRSTMEGYRSIMLKYGDGGKRIWPTEFGWAAGGAFDNRYLYANDNTYQEQAEWTVKAYQMMRNWGFVGPAFLWNLNFRVVANGTEKAQWGIVGPNWDPLPTYNALAGMPK